MRWWHWKLHPNNSYVAIIRFIAIFDKYCDKSNSIWYIQSSEKLNGLIRCNGDASKMAKSKAALYAAGITCLGFICFTLASIAIGLPFWGYYDSLTDGYDYDHGYFGPFKVCKQLAYNREKCGVDVSKFRLTCK